jgi:hypothetical protein
MKDLKRIGSVFPFNEVNAGVFQNAGLWSAKQNFGIETVIYAPKQFSGLYFATDKILDISPLPYISYNEVAEFEPNVISKKDFKTWLSAGTANYIHHKILERLPARVFHGAPKKLTSDYKTKKYLVDSGIYKFTKHNFFLTFPREESKFMDSLYVNLANLELRKKNLAEYFQYSFENLRNMVLSDKMNIPKLRQEHLDFKLYETEFNFLDNFLKDSRNNSSPIIFLRTRNVNSSVRFQNAPILELTNLVSGLLAAGFCVINSGVPAAKLPISHSSYLEFSHNLPIHIEITLAGECDFIMQTAWAGLFTAFASVQKNLITFQEEWSLTNIKTPVSIMDARLEIGMNDVQLLNDFGGSKSSVDSAVSKITKMCNR